MQPREGIPPRDSVVEPRPHPACGRRILSKASDFFKDNLLMVMLILINATFIPTIKYAVSQFLCAPYSCPVGYTFNPYVERAANDFSTSPHMYCDRCDFVGKTATMWCINCLAPNGL